jgi:hypothetical protein
MPSEFLKLNIRDVGKAVVTAVISAVLVAVYALFQEKGFNWTQQDLMNILNAAVASGFGYIIKNFFTTSDGKFMGKI